jgi:hypothetical protein
MPSGALKLQDLLPLLANLGAHELDFRTNVLQPHTAPPYFHSEIVQNKNRMTSH